MKNVYGYIRVSTQRQGEGVSLMVQKEAITRYASQYNLNIIKWFEEKETAAKQGRPLFTLMMKLLKSQKGDGVIIHKIDRSARNLKDWADLGNLIDQGVEVHFAHESLDMHARGGRLSADIQAVIAADYIRNLRQEAIKGLYGRLKQGLYPWHAPVGYRNNGAGGKHKTIDTIQGPLVHKMFELYATEKYTLKSLALHMHRLGLRNIKHRRVNINGYSLILNNPFYMGIIRVKGTYFNGGHQPLVTPQLFNKVQSILRDKTNQKTTKHQFKFRKLLECKNCGFSLTAEKQKGHIYYRCHTKGCFTKGIREIAINNLLLNTFKAIQLYPQEYVFLHEILQEAEKDWFNKQQGLLSAIKLDAGKIQQALERLTDCYVEGGLEKETYEQRKRQLLIETKTKEAAQKELMFEKERVLKKAQNFFELGKNLVKSYEVAIFEEIRELLNMITSNLAIEGKKLIISMHSPFLELANRHLISSSGHHRDTPRKMNREFVYSNINTSPIIGPPLSKKELHVFFNEILQVLEKLPESAQLPDDNSEAKL